MTTELGDDDIDLGLLRQNLTEVPGVGGIAPVLLPSELEVWWLCRTAREIFMSQESLLELTAPFRIVGNIHGQFTDFLRLLEYGGFPPEHNYLFLGDYVGRGQQSIEVLLLLLIFKIEGPENLFMLRGHHECASVTRIHGFYDECKRHYSIKTWKMFCDLFNCLPYAAVIDDKIFCVHGGISPEITDLEVLRHIVRPTEVPDSGLICDLLWADPDVNVVGWQESARGVSYVFGPDVVQGFLRKHDLDLIVRAHQVVQDGYEFFAKRSMITLFSAPNYAGEFENAGAMMTIDETLMCSFKILKPFVVCRQ